MNVNRKHVQQFIEDFRRTRQDKVTKRIDRGADLVRDLTIIAVKTARQPLTIDEVYKSVVDRNVAHFNIHHAFFLTSICSRMDETGIVIAGGKVYVL